MDLRIGHLNFSTAARGPPSARPRRPPRRGLASARRASDVGRDRRHPRGAAGGRPARGGPAAARADELGARTASCTSRMDEDTGRVIVQVRDLDGNVLRTIPPSEALDVMSGRPL